MSLLSEHIIPGDSGKVFTTNATKESDLKSAIEMLSVTNIIGTVLNKSMY